MSVVVDGSVIAAMLLPDERPNSADILFTRLIETGAHAPSILRYEFLNVLLTAERRGRLNRDTADELAEAFGSLPIQYTQPAEHGVLLRLARRHMLTAYDASYLHLALQRNLALATLDRALTRAAREEAVVLL